MIAKVRKTNWKLQRKAKVVLTQWRREKRKSTKAKKSQVLYKQTNSWIFQRDQTSRQDKLQKGIEDTNIIIIEADNKITRE